MASHFHPCHQLGVGTSAGMEILTHAFRSALTTHTDWCTLQIDVANAFNSFHQRTMFHGLQESPFLGLIPFLGIFYGTPSDLYLRAGPFVETLASARGSRQGDPLEPFLFAFTQQLVMEPVTREFAGLLFLSYADDTYISGPAARLLEAFGVLRERLQGVGLEVQAPKCRFWVWEVSDMVQEMPLGMQRVGGTHSDGGPHWSGGLGGGSFGGVASAAADALAMAPLPRPPADGFTPLGYRCFSVADVPRTDRAAAARGPGAGAWVSAVPAHADFTFTAAERSIAAAVHLGLPIQQLHMAGRCVCGTVYADPADPHHALQCNVWMLQCVEEAHALEISVEYPLSLSPSLVGQCGRSVGVAAKEWE
ncbi:unnamed protein product [Closterium sp. NIES-54]